MIDWIKCSERLPSRDDYYFVYLIDSSSSYKAAVAAYNLHTFSDPYEAQSLDVSHWAEITEPKDIL